MTQDHLNTTGEIPIPVPSTSLWLDLEADRMHIRRFGDPNHVPVLLLHGSLEDGRVFYSRKGKGLAPYLAINGFDVFVPDFRGHGYSTPLVSRNSKYGQHGMIRCEIPAILAAMRKWTGDQPYHIIAHSWGGVLMSACLARHPELIYGIQSITYFGSKRCIHVKNTERRIKVDFMWRFLGSILTRMYGYLPAKKLGLGPANETRAFHRQCMRWAKPSPWTDPLDGFDFGEAAMGTRFPPTWFIAGEGDRCLGHPDDVYAFMLEHGDQPFRFTVLSKSNGNTRDYGHVDMLTDPEAPDDHFPLVVEWLRGEYHAELLKHQ